MSDEQGAFVEMLAASLNAVEKAQIRLGDLVVIYGPGPVGLSMVQLAKASGGRVVIVGTRDYRLELAKGMGAEHAFNIADTASPYYTADLAASIQRGQRGRARRQGDRRDGLRGRDAGRARRHRQRLDDRLHGPRRPGRHRQAADALEPRDGQDDPLLVALPQPVAEHDPAAARGRRRHVEDHHPLDRARPRSTRASGRSSRATTASSRSSSSPRKRNGQAEILRFRDHDVPSDVRRGSRELRRGGRRGSRHLGVQAAPRTATTARRSRS